MSDQATETTTGTWQPEPATFHPSLGEWQRHAAFVLNPTVPEGGGRMIKGPAYHAPCGSNLSNKHLDDPQPGEYGCPTCNERGYLVKPVEASQPNADPAVSSETRALVAVEVAERLSVKAHQALGEIPERDLWDSPSPIVDAVKRAQALLEELATTTTNTTCSLVKDQTRSDRISRAASASVRRSLERVETARP